MATNISARPFSLTINGIDRAPNLISISLSQDELGDKAVLISGQITLKANYSQRIDFTYLASPAIAANWARGVQVIYQIANDSGTLTNHLLSGARLFILQEPAPPDENGQITLQVGDETTLKNYRTPIVDASGIVNVTGDPSGVLDGTVTPRDTVIKNYLDAAGITYSISSISYPFLYSQPQLANGTLGDTAGKMARSANHILHTNSAGILVNSAIDLSVSAIAFFTIGSDEKLFNYVDSSGIETTVDELIISGLSTQVEGQSFPYTTTALSKTFLYSYNLYSVLSKIEYYTKRVTVKNYGWNGVYEHINILTETAGKGDISGYNTNQIAADPAAWLANESETASYYFYDSKSRLIRSFERKYSYIFIVSSGGSRFPSFSNNFVSTKINSQDVEITYTYSDKSILTNKRTETTKYEITTNSPYAKLAVEESWGDGFYSVANFFQDSDLTFVTDPFTNRLVLKLLPWQASNSDIIYARDSSTKPPKTIYREPFKATENQINVKLKAKPFAGDSLKARSRPVEVDFLVSEAQATAYGNVFLALLYGRKQSFIFATAINDNLLANLKPLTRIDVTWKGVIYQCLVDGITWAHTLTEMVIGMRLIPLRTALVATPSVTSDLVTASPMIEVSLLQSSSISCELNSGNYLGGILQQSNAITCTLTSGLTISATLAQSQSISCTLS